MTDTDTTNGTRPRGRAAPELETFTFANGVVARINPVSPMTLAHVMQQLVKQYPPPQPPMDPVDRGNGEELAPNYSNPDYLKAKEEHDNHIGYKANEVLLDLGVDIEIDHDAYGRMKQTLARRGIPLDSSDDKLNYLQLCCIQSADELTRLIQLVSGFSEEDVQAHVETFPNHVQGS